MTFEHVQKSDYKVPQPQHKDLPHTALITTEQIAETASHGNGRSPRFQHDFSQVPVGKGSFPALQLKPKLNLQEEKVDSATPQKVNLFHPNHDSKLLTSVAVVMRGQNSVIQRTKQYQGGTLTNLVVGAEPKTKDWAVCRVGGDINDTVYVRVDELEPFFSEYATQEAELLHYANESGEVVKESEELKESEEKVPTQPSEIEVSDIDFLGGGLDTEQAAAKSRRIHFKNYADKIRNTIDPHEIGLDQFSIDALTKASLPGQIGSVKYKAPAGDRTHYEITCIATGKDAESQPVFIKFDFTTDGYRMLYGAEDRDEGLKTLDTVDVSSKSIMVSDATGMFAMRAYKNKEYEEGRNTCHTFAVDFFQDLTGKIPKGEEDPSFLFG